METSGNWQEFPEGAIEAEIRKRAGNPDTSKAEEASEKARDVFQHRRDDIISLLRIAKDKHHDAFLEKLLE